MRNLVQRLKSLASLYKLRGSTQSDEVEIDEPISLDEVSIDWRVSSDFDKFPFRIGKFEFYGMVDTGASPGIYLPYDIFIQLEEDLIRNISPYKVKDWSGKIFEGIEGECSIALIDDGCNERIFEDVQVFSCPAGPKNNATIGRQFLNLIDGWLFSTNQDGLYVQAVMYRK